MTAPEVRHNENLRDYIARCEKLGIPIEEAHQAYTLDSLADEAKRATDVQDLKWVVQQLIDHLRGRNG